MEFEKGDLSDNKPSEIKSDNEESQEIVLEIPSLLVNLKSLKSLTESIVQDLTNLRAVIVTHHSAVLKAKTGGTTIATIGTGLAITGLILAPFTFGTSLIVSGVGAATSLGGAATNMIADVVDYSKRKKYVESIHTLAEKQQVEKSELQSQLCKLDELVVPLMAKGLTKSQAVFASLLCGDKANDFTEEKELNISEGANSFEWVDAPLAGKYKPITKFAFKTTVQSMKLVKTSHALSALTITARSGATAVSNVSLGVGRIIGTVVARSTLAAVGVVFTSIDIALLVKDWKKQDPQVSTIDYVLEELRGELERVDDFIHVLESIIDSWGWKGGQVVGTSPFAVKALTEIVLCGKTDFLEKFYGVKGTHPDCKEILQKYKVGPNSELSMIGIGVENENFEIPEEYIIPVKQVTEILPLSLDHTSEVFEVAVIDQSILNLNATIINTFLSTVTSEQNYFANIKNRFESTQIIRDYYHPFDHNMEFTIKQILTAYVKVGAIASNDGYINANKWEFDVLMKMIREQAVLLLRQEYLTLKNSNSTNPEEDDVVSETLLESLDCLIETIISHKSFVDPVAAALWDGVEEKANTLRLAVQGVTDFLRCFKWRLRIWAGEFAQIGTDF